MSIYRHGTPKFQGCNHHRRKKFIKEESDEGKMVIPSSASDIPIDHDSQVYRTSANSVNKRGSLESDEKPQSCCVPKLFYESPGELRNAFFNEGTGTTCYWSTVLHTSAMLEVVSSIQFALYFAVFGLIGQYRIKIALLPVRVYLLCWCLSLNGADFLVVSFIRLGKWVCNRFNLTKGEGTYFILASTVILAVTFVGTITFPIYAAPNLLASVNSTSTIQQNATLCLEPRNAFMEAGTSWDAIPVLQRICAEHILCIKPCRDFRALYIWVYGLYILAVFRLFVLVRLWNTVSFLCIIKGMREDLVAYQFRLGTQLV